MSTSSSEEGSWMAGHHATSSGLEATGSPRLHSLPSDSWDVQTETTPPTSAAPFEEKICTPRKIFEPSRRPGWFASQAPLESLDIAPSKPPKQNRRHAPFGSISSDEAGYDADRDGDGAGDRGRRAGTGIATPTRFVRRPGFLRIDTRQHRRVASMLAVGRRPTSPSEPGFGDESLPRHPRTKLAAPLPSVCFRPAAAAPTAAQNLEIYELRRRPKAEPIGLGIGFPENHPLQSRAFSVPVLPPPASAISSSWPDEPEEVTWEKEQRHGQPRRNVWFPTSLQAGPKKKSTHVGTFVAGPARVG